MLTENGSRDTSFSLPACDDHPSTEIGVVVMGLPAVHLLAGLGGSVLADDAVQATLLVDYLRHGGAYAITFGQLVEAGASRWDAVRPALANVGLVRRHPLRQAWSQAYTAVSRLISPADTAAAVYLTACWLRESEVSDYVANRLKEELTDDVPRITAR